MCKCGGRLPQKRSKMSIKIWSTGQKNTLIVLVRHVWVRGWMDVMCVPAFAWLLCSVECSYKQDHALKCLDAFEDVLKMFPHSSPCQYVYSVCKESWATTACGAYRWGRSMDSRVSVCCEYPVTCKAVEKPHRQSWDSFSTFLCTFFSFIVLSPFFLGLSMVTTYHWYQREPSKTCHRSPTCE